ncbi:MAG: AbrB/MazE/SpoVT family DNA-binding domain-containing protein [Rhodoferax sp.]|jgi:AbrB family looped-hinge helix DNA binding protein|uniref:AbrB/MazE/SpoVT family DNA-binding domain-containing protein n=1 Tax=Rhodoferax sp. TaxID=50421 RepID=UPI003BB7D9C3
MPTATLTSKGQITIPLEIRNALGLHTGATLDFVQEQDGFKVRPLHSSTATLKGRFAGRVARAVSIAEMDEAIAAQAAERQTAESKAQP